MSWNLSFNFIITSQHKAEARYLPKILANSCLKGLRQFSLSLFSSHHQSFNIYIFSFFQTYRYLVFLNSPRYVWFNSMNCLVIPPDTFSNFSVHYFRFETKHPSPLHHPPHPLLYMCYPCQNKYHVEIRQFVTRYKQIIFYVGINKFQHQNRENLI